MSKYAFYIPSTNVAPSTISAAELFRQSLEYTTMSLALGFGQRVLYDNTIKDHVLSSFLVTEHPDEGELSMSSVDCPAFSAIVDIAFETIKNWAKKQNKFYNNDKLEDAILCQLSTAHAAGFSCSTIEQYVDQVDSLAHAVSRVNG